MNSEDIKSFPTDCAPSYIPNNLTSNNNMLFFIHNSESQPRIMEINKKLFENNNNNTKYINPFNNNETYEMLFCKSINLNYNNYIAVGLYGGFKLWNSEGSRLLFQIPTRNKIEGKTYAFLTCCEFKSDSSSSVSDSILSCDNYGQIFLINGRESNWKSERIFHYDNKSIISIGNSLGFNKVGITCENMNVILLKIQNNVCDNLKTFQEKLIGVCSDSIKLNNNEYYYVVGFMNGEIKLYNFNKLTVDYDICSHLRGINSLIIVNECIITGGEDGCVNIWKVNGKEEKVELKKNLLFEDKMVVGVDYDDKKNCLFVNFFDFSEVLKISNVNFN